MKLMKRILNEKGISLVNVLLAAAMLGGLALVMGKLGENQAKMQRKAVEDQGLNSFVNNMEKHLINNIACGNTFSSVSGLNSDGDSDTIDSIKNFNDVVVYNMTDKAPSPQLSITNMTVTRLDSTSLELEVDIRKKVMGKSIGANTFTKRFKLDALISGGAVTKCYSQLDGAVQSACASLDGEISGTRCINTYLEEGDNSYPQVCGLDLRYVTHGGGGIRNEMSMRFKDKGLHGIKLIGDSNLDDDNYLYIRPYCPSTGGNEFDDYLRNRCYIGFGQRDSADSSSSANRSPTRSYTKKFSSNSSNFSGMSFGRFQGEVNDDDRLYYKMYCDNDSTYEETINFINNNCKICMGHSDSHRDMSPDRVTCSPVTTTGIGGSKWGQLSMDGNVGADDTFFFGLFCGDYSPVVFKTDVTN